MTPAIPQTMTVVEISKPGGPEVLKTAARAVPRPRAGEVLIKVAGAGLNGADLTQRQGRYSMPPGVTDIPGLEASGTVVALGEGVRACQPGDKICALLSGGGYAEYATAPALQCMPIPDNVALADAGALPETFCTVWTNVFERARLKAGETILVQGGSSGIGYTAIQLAKAFGAKVLATARTAEKLKACERFGADRAINYKEEDFLEAGRAFTGGRGVDVILDIVGGPYIPKELELLAHGGRLVFVNLKGGRIVEADFGLIQAKHLIVTGSRLRPLSIEEKGKICAQLTEQVWPLFASGKVKPEIYRRFPLHEAAAAHRLMESSEHIGKILLTI
jgi:putative PIG3 family NAD(P)H quinone oxidoreductase